jgi:hypothetical protein
MTARRRNPFDVLVAVVGIVVAVWFSYWYVANQLAFSAMRSALASAGDGTHCTAMTARGFPLRLDAGCEDIVVPEAGSAPLHLKGLSATAPLYWPLSIEAALRAPLRVDGPEGAMTLAWQAASGKVEAGWRGVRSLAASASDVKLSGAIDVPRLELAGVSAEAAELTLAPAPAGAGDYRLELKADGIHPEAADKREMPVVALDGEAVLVGVGRALGLDPGRTLRAWSAGGGKVRLERLALSAGPVTASGSGDLTLPPNGILSGKIVVRFTKLEELPAVLEALQPGSRTAAAVGRLLLAVTRKVATEEGPVRETTLNLGGGFLSVGIVPIAALPRIRF